MYFSRHVFPYLGRHLPAITAGSRHGLVGLTTLVTLALAACPAQAQVVLTPADSQTGAPGASGGGTADPNGTFVGDSGQDGYDANSSGTTYTVNGAAFTGGAGGAVTGTDSHANYLGGTGGSGLAAQSGATVTINSGTFTGGRGGAAGGVGALLVGGYGGDGLNVNESTAVIYGGVFQGGDNGVSTMSKSASAGSGLNANSGSTVSVYGGTFLGGSRSSGDSVAPYGSAGDGLADLTGALNVYGGTFTGASGGFDIHVFYGPTTLYGDFTYNGVEHYTGAVTGEGTLTGTFQNNAGVSTFTYRVNDYPSASLTISAAPEPSSLAAIGAGGLGVLGLVLRAKKRQGVPGA